jgi:hypothetical protein
MKNKTSTSIAPADLSMQTSALAQPEAVAAEPAREHPPLPGGGSWTFDEATWTWVSNDPVAPEVAADTPITTEE